MLRLSNVVQAGDPYALIHGVTGRPYAIGILQDEADAYVIKASGLIIPDRFNVGSEYISLTVLIAGDPDATHGTLARYRLPLTRLSKLQAAGIPVERL